MMHRSGSGVGFTQALATKTILVRRIISLLVFILLWDLGAMKTQVNMKQIYFFHLLKQHWFQKRNWEKKNILLNGS